MIDFSTGKTFAPGSYRVLIQDNCGFTQSDASPNFVDRITGKAYRHNRQRQPTARDECRGPSGQPAASGDA